MDKERIKALKKYIKDCDKQLNNLKKQVEAIFDEQERLSIERGKYNKELVRLSFDKNAIKEGNCYKIVNKDASYAHGDIAFIVCIDKIDGECVYYRKFIIREDDGDKTFFVESHMYNIYYVWDLYCSYKSKQSYYELTKITKEDAQAEIDKWLMIDKQED